MRREAKSRSELRAARKQVTVPTDLLPPTLDAAYAPPEPDAQEETGSSTTQGSSAEVPSLPSGDRPRHGQAKNPKTQAADDAPGEAASPLASTNRPRVSNARDEQPAITAAAAQTAVRCFFLLSGEQIAWLEQIASRIGGVTAEAVLRKAAKDWKPQFVGIDLASPPVLGPRGGAARRSDEDRRYRVDFRFTVSAKDLADYRERHDKLALLSDGVLLRHFGQPVFEKHLASVAARLVG